MKSVEYKPGDNMKKNYSNILWALAFILLFVFLYKNDRLTQEKIAYYQEENMRHFYSSKRIDKAREEVIKNIVKKADDTRYIAFLKNKIREESDAEAAAGVNHVKDLQKKYPQVKGRIIVDGTSIDFPVVQGDDNEFYLDHDYDNSYYINGGVFIDYVHQGDFSDQNTVIYGHNVRIGYIFHDLDKFRDKNFIKKHSEIIIDTPLARRVFEVVCAMDVNVDADYRFNYYDDDEFKDYLKLISDNNILENRPLPKKDDKLITLSTCSDLNDRYAIVAVEKKEAYVNKKNFNYRKAVQSLEKRPSRDISIY